MDQAVRQLVRVIGVRVGLGLGSRSDLFEAGLVSTEMYLDS